MTAHTRDIGSETLAREIDVADIVRLRWRVSRAATSIKIIGFLSAIDILLSSSDYFGFFPTLLAAMSLPGFAALTAKRLNGVTTPRKLDAREAASFYMAKPAPFEGRPLTHAYARTACGRTFKGSSPALQQFNS